MGHSVKLASSYFGEEEAAAARRVLLEQNISLGSETRMFEEELKAFFGRDDIFVVGTSSCTAALQLTLQGLGIGAGNEVLVPTMTFIATFQAVSASGAMPIACDICLEDGFIDLEDAAKRVTNKTKAIIPVLYAGIDNRIGEVYAFARAHGLHVIEDAAHSFGNAGVVDRAGYLCFSFDPIKNISCGDGGAIVSNDKCFVERVQDLRLLGVLGDTEKRYSGQRSWEFNVVEQGWRYHMNNLAAAIGRAQLRKWDEISRKRKAVANAYVTALKNRGWLHLFPLDMGRIVPHIFPVLVQPDIRDRLVTRLEEVGIETGPKYKPCHQLSKYSGSELKTADEFYRSIVTLPLHPRITFEECEFVVKQICDFRP